MTKLITLVSPPLQGFELPPADYIGFTDLNNLVLASFNKLRAQPTTNGRRYWTTDIPKPWDETELKDKIRHRFSLPPWNNLVYQMTSEFLSDPQYIELGSTRDARKGWLYAGRELEITRLPLPIARALEGTKENVDVVLTFDPRYEWRLRTHKGVPSDRPSSRHSG